MARKPSTTIPPRRLSLVRDIAWEAFTPSVQLPKLPILPSDAVVSEKKFICALVARVVANFVGV